MSTIYDPDARTVNALTRTLFIVAIGLGVVGLWRSATDGWVYELLFFLLSGYTLYMRYWCERYTTFALSYFTLMIFLLALAPRGSVTPWSRMTWEVLRLRDVEPPG